MCFSLSSCGCSSGRTTEGLAEIELALSCKYVAADATKALNKIYQVGVEPHHDHVDG